MLRRFIEGSLKFQLLVIAFALIVILIGLLQLFRLPVDALPEFAPPFINIQTEAPGLSTPEVEELVTYNLEELLNGTPWMQSIRSISIPGLSSITLTFEPGTDIMRARQLVSERLSLAYALPNVAQSPVILQPQSAMSRVMVVGLTSKQISPIDMSVLAYWNIRPALLSVPGVANVAIWGLRNKQFTVETDTNILKNKNITLDQIISTTGNALWVSPLSFLNASTPGSGGWIDTPQQRLEVRHIMPISTPHDLGQINIEGSKLNLGDVTSITTGFPPLIGDDVINDGDGLLVVVHKFPGTNTLDVSRNLEQKLSQLEPGLTGIQIDKTIFRPATFVETVIANNSMAFALGFIFLILSLFILMRSWRAVLICLINITVAFALAILILSFLGVTINIMLLTGLMLAMVIVSDEVIIDVEQLFLHSQEMSTSTTSFMLMSLLNNRNSMFYSTLIIILSILPIFFLTGIAAAFFQPLIIAYIITIIASMLIAWFFTPALCLLLLSAKSRRFKKRSATRYYRNYLTDFSEALSARMLVACSISFAIIILLAFIFFMAFKTPELLPQFKDHSLLVQWEGPPGTSTEEMIRITKRVSNELCSVPGVQNIAVDIGRATLGDQIVNVNAAQLIINIDPKANYNATRDAIQNIIDGYPGIYHFVQTYLNERTQQILTGTPYDVVVRIFGHEFSNLRSKAVEIKQVLSKIAGAHDIHLDAQIVQPEIGIKVNLAKAQQYGLSPGDIRRAAATLVAGLQVGSLFDEQKIFPVVVWGTANIRNSISGLSSLLIDTPSKQWVRLDQVADIFIRPSPNFIEHNTVSRSFDIGVNTSRQHASTIVNEIEKQLKNISFPKESHVEVLSIYQHHWLTMQRLVISSLVIAIVIFLILQAIFESFILAALILFTLPIAFIGGILVAIAFGNTCIALVGLLAIFAITIRHTIMSISYFQMKKEKQKKSHKEEVYNLACDRFLPLILTTCAIIAALLPSVFLFNQPGLEIVAPTAAIIIGGMLTSFIYTSFIVPVLYLFFGKSK